MFLFPLAERQMTMSTPQLGEEALLPVSLCGTEELSRLYAFEIEFETSRLFQPKFEELLGLPATLKVSLAFDLFRYFHGILSELTEVDTEFDTVRYRATLSPTLWQFTRQVQCRVFQQMTIPEILTAALDGLDFRLDLAGVYEPRDYCVQYRESDFDFISRLMEEEGIYYYFEHFVDHHVMVLLDANEKAPPLAEPQSIIYDRVEGGAREELRIDRWEKSQQVATTNFVLRDHCFELQEQPLEVNHALPETAEIGQVEHKLKGPVVMERYDYPGAYAQRFDGVTPGGGDRSADLQKISEDGERTVKLRAQEAAARSVVCRGRSDCVHFSTGSVFELTEHLVGNGKYLFTKIRHEARLSTPLRSTNEAPEMKYENHFDCLPLAIVYRPPRITPKPIISGPQSATVCAGSGKEIFVDKYGRVKVQFRWDRQGGFNADSSCWVRVGQVWAGPRWGAFFWPRKGHEVIVAFEEGDPDRPLIIGNTYNSTNMPPFVMPDNYSLCGIKSCSYEGGDPLNNFNCVVFYDSKGNEHLHLHSETYENITCESQKVSFVPGPAYHMKGSMPFPFNSGGGGGEEGGEGGGEGEKKPDGSGYSYYETIQGDTTTVSFGENANHTFGAKLNLTADWKSMVLKGLGVEAIVPSPLFSAVMGYGGQVNIDMVERANIMYGCLTTVNRGSGYRVHEWDFFEASPAETPMVARAVATLVRVLTSLTLLTDFILNLITRVKYTVAYETGKTTANFSQESYEENWPYWHKWIFPRMIGILVSVEQIYAMLTASKADLTMSGGSLAKCLTLGARANPNAEHHSSTVGQKIAHWLTRLVEPAEGTYASHGTRICETGDYVIDTRSSIELRTAHPTQATNIVVASEGSSPGADGGKVAIWGTNSAAMSSGSASVTCNNADPAAPKVGVDGSATGLVQITCGVPDVGPTITLDGVANTITLSVAEAKIVLSLESILISIGATVAELSPAMIDLTCGSNVNVSEAAISLESDAIAVVGDEVVLQCGTSCDILGGAEMTVTAGMVAIN
ncbi:type VI secretion system Vgr family protein [Lignipirellula cremea]|uniref:Phage-related baseplate assembly protein n=1 Tax=Lignipirellula cremea TaxID=2528010 RepID=A0A518DTH4_9BACT|nr:type VI secretion system tip protein TssI/VgrG [Lignipirellula cremea]QDU95134.1 Phage-related baseplate assembly protein [Lignipirellula cremea]